MKIHSIRAVLVVVALVAAALSSTACGKSNTNSTIVSGVSATSVSASGNGFEDSSKSPGKDQGGKAAPATTPPNLPTPTAQELNNKLNQAFDKSVPSKDKIAWIEDADRDPELVDKLADAAQKSGVKVTITRVEDPSNGKLKADADVTINGTPVNGASVPFVASGDQWKVDHQYACGIVKQAKLDSAACQ
ncbi:hypothetical protein ACIBG0_40710 [Nocardia sp. NPDC050630]|uniref:hypothetical protein n=1 Tax=Nocardia sp. NPDC050630 TaxID=3364321 RepID=UPI00379337BA